MGCADTSGLSLIPPVRSRWAPRGQIPMLHHRFRRDRLSVAGFICYHPHGRRVRLLVEHTRGAYHTAALIQARQRLPTLLNGDPAIVVWDQSPAHRSREMKAWLHGQTHWLQVVELPGYAPELNPVESMWSSPT